jgi:hypothetical protein
VNWPNNFVSKAQELGIISSINYQGNAPASRGNVALMSYSVMDKIADANKPAVPSDPDYADLAGPLANFSGRAFGIILDYAKILNEDGRCS